jgi:hypothetical protein
LTDEDSTERADKAAQLATQARQLLAEPPPDLSATLNALLQPHIGSFKCDAAEIVANNGTRTQSFASVIHTGTAPVGGPVPIDTVVAVIDAYERLTVESLEQAYQRTAQLKAFVKTDLDTSGDATARVMTAFIVLARESDLALDHISDEMARLNKATSCYRWPDMVAVAAKGFVNYTTRIPGDNQSGDFFLPTKGYTASSSPPLYITRAIRAAGDRTFNKVLSFICARLGIYQPGIAIERHETWLNGLPVHGIAAEAYQFNLAAELRPIADQDLINQYLPTDIFHILANGKKALGSVQFQRWQDGGVFIVRGEFPLEMFLIFLLQQVPSLKPKDMGFIRRPGIQISNVLPITEQDFLRTLDIFETRSSNVTVRKDTRTVMIQTFADEGTNSPFYARLMLGVFRMREPIEDVAVRDRFDKAYEPTLATLSSARDYAKDLLDLWSIHQKKIMTREIVEVSGNQIRITENVDRQLKRNFEGFVNVAARTLKQCMQNLTKQCGTDIGFFFAKDGACRDGIQRLRATDPLLADYLTQARTWSHPLMILRNEDLEHGAGINLRVICVTENGIVSAREPEIHGERLSVFVPRVMDRVACFVEEVTVHHLQRAIPQGVTIAEVPLADRPPEVVERFRLTVSVGGLSPWRLSPHQRRFEDS